MKPVALLIFGPLCLYLLAGCGGGGSGTVTPLPNTGPPVTVNGTIDVWTVLGATGAIYNPTVSVFSVGHGGDSRYLIAKISDEGGGGRFSWFQLTVPHEGLYDFQVDYAGILDGERFRGTCAMMSVRLTAPTTAVTILSGGP